MLNLLQAERIILSLHWSNRLSCRHKTPSFMGWNRRQTSVCPWYCVLYSPWKAKPEALSLTPHITWLEVHLLQENCTWIIWQKDNGLCSLHVKHCMNSIKITLLWALHVIRHYVISKFSVKFLKLGPRKCNKASAKNPDIFIFTLKQKSESGLQPSVTEKHFRVDLKRPHENVM